jgi:hypothetical protein
VKEQGEIAKCDKKLQQQRKATKRRSNTKQQAMLSNKQHKTTSNST